MQGNFMRYRLLPGLVFLSCAQLGVAEEAPGLPFSGAADDMPMVLSAARLHQSFFDAPAAVTVIDRQMIEQSGIREIPELLRMVPGMVVGYESGSEAFVSYHGTSADLARRMQVLVDGRSIYQPLLASVDWIGLPLDISDIERIEVIRGPNAATYGVNSFFAVVNIITRHPADVAGAKVSYRRGENGIEDYHARIAQQEGRMDWRLSMAGRADEGFVENRRRNNADFTDTKNTDSLYGRAVWSIDDNSSLEFAAGRAVMDAQQQYRPDFFIDAPLAERENRFASVVWDTDLGASHQLRVQGNHSRFNRKEPWLTALPPVVFLPELGSLYMQNRACALEALDGVYTSCTPADMPLLGAIGAALADPTRDYMTERVFLSGIYGKEARTELDVQDTWIFSPTFRSVFGLSYDRSDVASTTYLNGKVSNAVWGVFAHAEWQIAPRWLLNVGGGQEFDEEAGDFFSPKAALNWQFVDNHVLRVIYSEGVRTPDILETSANWRYVSRDVLDPGSVYEGVFFQTGQSTGAPEETIKSSELGYFGRFDAVRLSADIRLFHDRMKLAEHNLEVEGFAISPVESLRMRGAELSADWRPLPSQRIQLNYAHLDMTGASTNDNANFVPKHSGSIGWWQEYPQGWTVGTTYYVYNDLRNSDTKQLTLFFDRLDMKLSKSFNLPGKQHLDLSAVMQWRLSEDAELRRENGMDTRHRGWMSAEWRY
jgi:iron complex outermembrane receptor protein